MKEIVSVLHIEDDLVDQMALKSAVAKQHLPYLIETAGSVAEARRLLTSVSFDVILSDYKLTDGTAFELFDLFKDQLVIFTTGSGDEETAVRAMQSGARDYMIKDPDRGYLQLLSQRVQIALRQRNAERQLRETEERYRDLVENANDLIYTADPEGILQFANQAWLNTLGYTEDEVKRLSILQVLHPEDREASLELFGHLLKGDKVGTVQLRFCSKAGHDVDVEGTMSCRMQNGIPVLTRGIFRNITERKRSDREREELVARLQQALSAVNVCLSTILKKNNL